MRFFKIPYLNLRSYVLDTSIVKIIPEEMARYFQVIALIVELLESRIKRRIMPFKIDIQDWADVINNNYVEEKIK